METRKSQSMTREEYEADLRNRGKKRKRRRKSRHSYAAPVLLVLVLLTCLALCLVFFFRVDTIQVRRTDLAQTEAVIKASAIEKGDNLLTLDIQAASAGIYGLNPEIDRCIVEKKYPSTVEIQLVRGKTVFYAEGKNGFYAVSGRSRISGVTAKPEKGMPVVRGIPEKCLKVGSFFSSEEPRYALAVKTLNTMKKLKMPHCDIVDVTDLYSVSILYDGRVRMVLGNESNLETKADSVVRTFRADFKPGEYGIIDGSIALHKTSVRKGEEHIAFFNRKKNEKPAEKEPASQEAVSGEQPAEKGSEPGPSGEEKS